LGRLYPVFFFSFGLIGGRFGRTKLDRARLEHTEQITKDRLGMGQCVNLTRKTGNPSKGNRTIEIPQKLHTSLVLYTSGKQIADNGHTLHGFGCV